MLSPLVRFLGRRLSNWASCFYHSFNGWGCVNFCLFCLFHCTVCAVSCHLFPYWSVYLVAAGMTVSLYWIKWAFEDEKYIAVLCYIGLLACMGCAALLAIIGLFLNIPESQTDRKSTR